MYTKYRPLIAYVKVNNQTKYKDSKQLHCQFCILANINGAYKS